MNNVAEKDINKLSIQAKLALMNANSYYGINPKITDDRKAAMLNCISKFYELKGEINELCKKPEA